MIVSGNRIRLMCAFLGAATAAWAEDAPKYLIIHSDDAGMCHSANRAIIDAMEKGVVSSTSIMVPCPWFKEFAEYARNHPEKDYGIHLTLTSEWTYYRWGPVAGREKVPSLVDEQGYLWDNVKLLAAHAKANEVETELRAQIERAREFGVPLSHLDAHMGGALCRPDIAQIYLKMGIVYDLPVLFVRVSPELLAAKKEYAHLAPHAEAICRKLDQHRLPILDSLGDDNYGVPASGKKDYFLNEIRSLRPGATQIIIHCGYADEELKGITESAARRDADARTFMDPEIKAEIDKQGVRIMTWRKLQEMVRSRPTATQPVR